MKRALGTMALTLSTAICGERPPIGRIVSVQVAHLRAAGGEGAPERALRTGIEDPVATALALALERCRGPEMVKFRGRYRVLATDRDGKQVSFLVLGGYAKVEGKAYLCPENVERLAERALNGDAPAGQPSAR